ncbi:MAG: putative toxin-antitoxin system toxin component, PIN family [Candidatus Omnitrophica bacterium]|nr:putative toxin-antitoxin system toxin component, PIN family [Candidatus Omnitrophota bacterium]MCA9417737.1 putative toxin-antitoxin system toxin component, PIN family [Candidatus Omnitrophota bacterium]MCA9424861.1 putative toxin-antitoxin system toxin component, PIN family [Candidatus Omnitrophota bacterium]MCA9433160.1 putative toxin-antitoxin system toxin component, PIN family [Candidatus Omnitrophota bacterium]MCA9436763.1 putative toxin-antitoxin system toxin component, PIN family [Can
MKVFLDTNVLVSAFSSTKFCSGLFVRLLESHEILISTEVLRELERILRTKISLPEEAIHTTIQFLMDRANVIHQNAQIDISIDDQDDALILTAAIAGEAEYFVTGDKEILNLNKIGRMKIMSPREFSDRLG